ncbi:19775_t:CDS:2, partial [Racocetra persica]
LLPEISEKISKRINEISDILDIKEAKHIIKSWYNNNELFSDDFDMAVFGLKSCYWNFNHTEEHISSMLIFEIFFNLFYDKNYTIEAQ